jgi:hypothetical protein
MVRAAEVISAEEIRRKVRLSTEPGGGWVFTPRATRDSAGLVHIRRVLPRGRAYRD